MAALGRQEWFRRAEMGERQSPRGSSVGVVRVWVFIRIWKGSLVLAFLIEAGEGVETNAGNHGLDEGKRFFSPGIG